MKNLLSVILAIGTMRGITITKTIKIGLTQEDLDTLNSKAITSQLAQNNLLYV